MRIIFHKSKSLLSFYEKSTQKLCNNKKKIKDTTNKFQTNAANDLINNIVENK